MAAIYKKLKPIENKLKAGLISEYEAVKEFAAIWKNATKSGQERRCAIKFIRENITDSDVAAAQLLMINLTK